MYSIGFKRADNKNYLFRNYGENRTLEDVEKSFIDNVEIFKSHNKENIKNDCFQYVILKSVLKDNETGNIIMEHIFVEC